MINPTKRIKITMPSCLPPFMWNASKYYNTDFYATTGSFKNMYRYQYSGDYYDSTLHPFKMRCYK